MAVTVIRTANTKCGFCNDGNHDRCAVGTKHRGRHEKYPNGVVWACSCSGGSCGKVDKTTKQRVRKTRRKCSTCGNRNTKEVSPETWDCLDIEACKATVTERRENDPILAKLRKAKEDAHMAKVENAEKKAEKEQKAKEPTFCLVTGEPTKGGLFKPGMDARYVSERVIEVENANFTKKAQDAALAKMKKDGTSETLQAKFVKSVGLAKERKDKKDAAAKEKADAKAAKAAEKAAAAAEKS